MRHYVSAALCVVAIAAPAAVSAQSAVEGRVDRLESEMRAVQRKVFPAGTVEPQITAPAATPELPGAPSSTPITDLTARVSALETTVRGLTGQVEQDGFRIRQLDEGFAAYKAATDARLKALEGAGAAPATPAAITGDTAPGDTAPPIAPPRATRPSAAPRDAADADPAAVRAIEKPDTGDAAEDSYAYGYRLWSAKRYDEAQAALKSFADTYPKHRRASFAQNLLGRAYLDDGKPSLASLAFYDSYKKFPDGERAPDSLYYLAQALVKLKKPAADVCKVYTELTDVYGAKLSAGMKADVARGRAAQKCK